MGQEDGVGLHRAAGLPREEQIGQGGIVDGLTSREGPLARVVTLGLEDVRLHGQQPTVDLAQLPAGHLGRGCLQQADVLLAGQDLHGPVIVSGSDDNLGEDLGDLLGHRDTDWAVGGDDAAEGAQRVTGVGLAMGLGNVRTGGDAARIGVLDDGDARLLEVEGGATGRVGVNVVVVAHGLAMQLPSSGQTGLAGALVDRSSLVGVLAVAQRMDKLTSHADEGRHSLAGDPVASGEPGGHRDVVGSGVGECSGCQDATLLAGVAALGQGSGEVLVLVRVGDDGNARVILGGRADHRRATDVDLLDALVEISPARHSLGEGVEVAHHEVERFDVELGQLITMGLQSAISKDAGVNLRVEGLDATVEALRESGDLTDLGHRHPVGGQLLGGRAGRDDLDLGVDEGLGQLAKARLVIDGDEGSTDGLTFTHCGSFRDGSVPSSCVPGRAPASSVTTSTSISRSSTLIRSWRDSTVSSARTGTARWARIRPVSTPASTTKTVAPVILTP